MSQEVMYYGELKEVEIIGGIENTCKLILENLGFNKEDMLYETYRELLEDEFDYYYPIINNKIYETVNVINGEEDDIFKIIKNNNKLHFIVKYYNGSMGFNTALQKAFDEAKNGHNIS